MLWEYVKCLTYWLYLLCCQHLAVTSFHFEGVGEAADDGLVFAVGQDAVSLFT